MSELHVECEGVDGDALCPTLIVEGACSVYDGRTRGEDVIDEEDPPAGYRAGDAGKHPLERLPAALSPLGRLGAAIACCTSPPS